MKEWTFFAEGRGGDVLLNGINIGIYCLRQGCLFLCNRSISFCALWTITSFAVGKKTQHFMAL